MQGVLARGTARAISGLAPYVAGKTGTSDEENDAWFVGFTNDVTVAVWLGYDNASGKRRTLGGGATGGGVAVPIFEPIIQAVWANVAPKTALAPPSPEARRKLSCKSVDLESGEVTSGRKVIAECLRVDGKGRVVDTQYLLVSRSGANPSLTGRPAGLPSESGPIIRTISRAPMTIGHANPGAQRHNGIRSGSMNSVGERRGGSRTRTGEAGVRASLSVLFQSTVNYSSDVQLRRQPCRTLSGSS